MHPSLFELHKSYFPPDFAELAGQDALELYSSEKIEEYYDAGFVVTENYGKDGTFVAPKFLIGLAGLDGDLEAGLNSLSCLSPGIHTVLFGLCDLAKETHNITGLPNLITINYLSHNQRVTKHRDGIEGHRSLALVFNAIGEGVLSMTDPKTNIPFCADLSPGDVVSFVNSDKLSEQAWHSAYKKPACPMRISIGFQLALNPE